uniref:INO80 complex subunit E N-terminal domain-containing protein n=1 Tax=Anopheles maculatus TaxID=74869 RepID=A0A182T857_9DIPT
MQNTSCEPSEAATAAVDEEVNAKYRQKYRRLKRYMTDMVFENAALSDHIAQVQEKIGQVSEERRFLLKKLLDYEHEMETQLGRPSSKLNELIANSLPPKRQYKKRDKNATVNGAPHTSTSGEGPADGQQDTQGTVKDETEVKVEKEDEPDGKSGAGERHGGKNGHRVGKKRGPAVKGESTAEGGKPRRKGRLGGTGKKRMQNIPVDQSGHPTYPFTVSGFSVQSLGEIVPDRSAFHTECTIYPIGYTITRPYGHYKDPEKRCNYTCRVVDGGERPRFEIVPECTDPSGTSGEVDELKVVGPEEDTISGPTTDACHAELLQRINTALNVRSIDSRPMGDWFFGLAHPTIANLLQSFPSAKACTNYRVVKRKENEANMEKENDPALSYDALMRHITISTYRTVPEIKEEPPDELFDHSDGNSFSLSV